MPKSSRKRTKSKTDIQVLAALMGLEDALGQKPLSWQELRDLGATVSPTEAEEYVAKGGLEDHQRSDIYCSLFQYHPELRAVLEPKYRNGPHHFIAKIAPGGGPDPLNELNWITRYAETSIGRTSWLPLRARGVQWRPAPEGRSSCIVFFRDDGDLTAIVAEIVERREKMPDDKHVKDFYRGHLGFNSWWRIANPRLGQLESLYNIPGRSMGDLPATKTFAGHVNFAYWDFEDNEAPGLQPGNQLFLTLF